MSSAISLATQCPHCHTTFKVADTQLQLKNGLVRCGVCQSVFHGSEHLTSDVLGRTGATQTDVGLADTRSPDPSPASAIEELSPSFPDPGQPAFLRQVKTKRRHSWLFLTGSLLLLLLLIGQTVYLFRDSIAAAVPTSTAKLATLCQYAGCQMQLPAQLSALSFEADELLSLEQNNRFKLSLLLRNRSRLTQAWPHIELSLKNPQQQIVLRRVFTPAEYLPDVRQVNTGFAAHQEQAVTIHFELDQIQATDYTTAIFYP